MTGVLLAGGAARRFGGNKLLATLANGDVVGLSAAAHLASAVERMVVVVRAGDEANRAAFSAAGYEVVPCLDADKGMGHSLACGVAATRDSAAWMVALADMPSIDPATLRLLAACWRREDSIILPRCGASAGHPVIFPARFGEELMTLHGDRGARRVLDAHEHEIYEFITDDRGVLYDVDTPADL
ncbi:MAG: nucleotidyltransferase family protein [Gammaproteobacteria bacterium]|nr:nucleotidyltransferase family protein [Gammaproteobacteria bacterium]